MGNILHGWENDNVVICLALVIASMWINDIFVKEKVQSSYFNRGEIITQEQLQNIQKSYLQSGVQTNSI